ncbi:hypothetical protein Purlil1_8978 [Purpureocillium lilacinum]|uniref:Uncharacterized protein n=1 Tax=Purpureocillium lilacinum TaxID=33203 RepID=A0ABR0BSB5_PURLI|nr:hypothetical protein Purlil1_8978 [Purpureocillium lilacinum]
MMGFEASERGLHGRGNGDDPKVGDKVRWEDLVAPRGAASNCERSQTGSCPHLHCSVQLRVRQCGCATGNAAPRQGRGGWEAAASRVGDSSSLPGAEGHKPTGHATGGSRCEAARFVNVTAPPPATGQLYKARATSRHGPIQLRRLERGLEISRAIKVKRGWCQGIGFVSGRHGCSEPGAGTVEHEVTMRCTQDMNQIGPRARQLLAVGAGGRRSSRRHGHLCHARPMPASQQKARRTWPPAAPEHEQEEWEADAPATVGRRRA